ncbi:hypothetical protein BCR32DRAFT_269795 [Anaeromyces robustus]|uniref:Exocyst complex component Sec3 PIP2-binding N-terminal domain-containing protein n=1 Tax=Anaeromyces robustus TaxID=1754192 RepID=A0A1Y1X0S0_9FUNG|nr:hypothetical protein BCR32DRAFT_269795 [Anaeromyces robustus]|eukprot:ORX78934.1 hypothetical protein BCR32DRAFT_269795 [Anaeromyces robustus]
MNPSSSEELEKIKNEITEQLFLGNVSTQSPAKNDTEKNQDKLFCVTEVFEESKLNGAANNYMYMKNLAKGGVLQKSSIEYKKKYKRRFLCIIVKKKWKIRIKKIKKNETTGMYSFCKKTWNLEDIKAIELNDKDKTFSITFNSKTLTWNCPNDRGRAEFLYMIAKFCKKYMKKIPKYYGFNELFLQNVVNSFKDEKNTEASKEITENDIENYEAEQKLKEEIVQVNLEELLKDINWKASSDATALVERLYNELTEIEANNVHSIFECEEQANLVVTQLDSAISELDLIDDLLTDYAKKLDDMGQDVKQIENKNKNLQTQTENQKLLYKQLSGLLNKLCLSSDIVSTLYSENLTTEEGIEKCEKAANELKEKIEIDINDDLRKLTAVTEKINLFHGYENHFSTRLSQCIIDECRKECDNYMKTKEKNKLVKKPRNQLQMFNRNSVQDVVFKYKNLIKWLRTIDPIKHNELLMNYVSVINEIYKKEIKEYSENIRFLFLEKKNEDVDYVFEKGIERINKIAQKIQNASTSQISMSILKDKKHRHFMKFGSNNNSNNSSSDVYKLNNTSIGRKIKEESSSSINKLMTLDNLVSLPDISGEKIYPPDAITNTLNQIVPLMIQEQNFIINIFQIKSNDSKKNSLQINTEINKEEKTENDEKEKENKDENEENEKKELENKEEEWKTLDPALLSKVNEPIKDLKIKKKIFDIMNGIFEEFKRELINIADAGTQSDPTFSIGMMVRTEGLLRDYKNTDQHYVYTVVESVFKHLVVVFDSYMERQFKAIDEFKSLRKKPQGVLPVISIFPNFVDCLEFNLENNDSETSGIVTITYERTSKKIFECIDALTKDVLNESEKYDEKDRLNVHILIIENMHFFSTELADRQVKTLRSYITEAKNRYNYHLKSYKKIVIYKTFGKFMEFFDGIEELLSTNAPEEVGYHFKFSKASLKSILRNYTRKDVKKGLENLYKQLFKHFSDENLIPEIWQSLQNEFTGHIKRIEDIINKCYANTNIKLDFTIEELQNMYSDIEKAK